MPDLPDELAALLRERADRAPVPPAASEAVVRAVRRRQYARAGTFVTGTALAVVAVVGVASAVVPAASRSITPTSPGDPPTPSPGDRETDCAYLNAPHASEFAPADGLLVGPGGETVSPGERETHEPRATESADDERPAEYGVAVDVDPEAPLFSSGSYRAYEGSTCLFAYNLGDTAHLLELRDAGGTAVWRGLRLDPNDTALHDDQPPLARGRHTLVCTIHPGMRADVEVVPAP
ncbi:MAG TPA: hypothetical protein VNA20_07160 [Frankiaceae bacterium]|nr:hypothetical protein [Frankiaceae bacterium]